MRTKLVLISHRKYQAIASICIPTAVCLLCLSVPVVAEKPSDGKSKVEEHVQYVVIVNTKNTWADKEKKKVASLLRRLYLKEGPKWPTGVTAKPIGRPAKSMTHRAFRDRVLKMTEEKLRKYWLKAKQTSGKSPPRAIARSKGVINLVKKYKGAFATVTLEEAQKAKGVKILYAIPRKEKEQRKTAN